MLCSIATAKSGSNWLDRLRSSKGFPTGDNLDLDHFLANPNPSNSPITNASDSPNSNSESTHSNDGQLQNPKPPPPEAISSDPEGDKEWFGIMSNVLSELFNMGEQAQTSRFSRKKASRKQTNPRICTLKTPEEQKSSSDNVRNDKDILVSTRSSNSREESKEAVENNNVEEDKEEGEGEGERELKGYSRSEVTVIDTSCPVWKVDKLIFRRKNIWKVKDKKGKSRTIGRKKRKPPPSDLNNVGISNKKPKISGLELRSLKETSGRECGSPANHMTKRKKFVMRDLLILPKFPFSRLPRKSGKGSSVVLMKAIPTGKKNGAKLAKNGLKDSQRQYKT
ncbi:rho GTPase-activating protein gacZ-like isoform X1 [Gossypium australe]|uniref:Rho GTPase-activating protein gacZ-like isoform X1 n=1 Tax=Gossypium australe TaxID=47621 RepID=A0A5B6V6J2_9ROSI|nr:rho GTPase-activating protein gacZ-like isoform X1 [Gossypium australe]